MGLKSPPNRSDELQRFSNGLSNGFQRFLSLEFIAYYRRRTAGDAVHFQQCIIPSQPYPDYICFKSQLFLKRFGHGQPLKLLAYLRNHVPYAPNLMVYLCVLTVREGPGFKTALLSSTRFKWLI